MFFSGGLYDGLTSQLGEQRQGEGLPGPGAGQGHGERVTRHFWTEAARQFLSGQAAIYKPPSLNPVSRKARSRSVVINSRGKDLP